jgi:hypothetical protein
VHIISGNIYRLFFRTKGVFLNKEVIQILPNSKDADLRNFYRRKNYRQTSGYPYRSWTQHEIDLVLAHNMPDRELSTQIQRSVMSIQLMRCRAKKGSSL